MAHKPYHECALRVEHRPHPSDVDDFGVEKVCAQVGAEARWIAVVDPKGDPYCDNEFLPTSRFARPEDESKLRAWVKEIHGHNMAAMSWYPMVLSDRGLQENPGWRHVFFGGTPDDSHSRYNACINTPYGDALCGFAAQAVTRFDLDGFWFDGSAFSQIWDTPIPLGCLCDHCRAKFAQDTGLDLPGDIDWDSDSFRRWVLWRYETFAGFWKRLADAIHQAKPEAAVVVNHYHRPGIPFHGAVPLNPFEADIISGSEAGVDAHRSAFTTRLVRAYGRPQSEVWTPLNRRGQGWEATAETAPMIQHALACVTAGGYPSFGGSPLNARLALEHVADMLYDRRDHIGLEPIQYAALHVSQQTETFFFGRNPLVAARQADPYWQSLLGWHELLTESQLPLEFIFDAHLTQDALEQYAVVVLPLSLCLTPEQAGALTKYVEGGGVLVVGPWAGQCDEWGQQRDRGALDDLLGVQWGDLPGFDGAPLQQVLWNCEYEEAEQISIPLSAMTADFRPGETPDGQVQAFLAQRADESSEHQPDSHVTGPAVIRRQAGDGQVIVLSCDVGGAYMALPTAYLREFIDALIRGTAKPQIDVIGPAQLHVGAYRGEDGSIQVHLHNFPGTTKRFGEPGGPVPGDPAPVPDVMVLLRRIVTENVRLVSGEQEPQVELATDGTFITVPEVHWHDILVIEP